MGSHLNQVLGLFQGGNTLLAAQKVPSSCSHLILRLLQQVAAAAAAGGLQLDELRAMPDSQANQEAADCPSQQQPGGPLDTSCMSLMFNVGLYVLLDTCAATCLCKTAVCCK
jgi:hypothetical protein